MGIVIIMNYIIKCVKGKIIQENKLYRSTNKLLYTINPKCLQN